MKFRDLPRGERASVEFLQQHGLLPSCRTCHNGHPMKLYFGSSIFWKCSFQQCHQKINMRKDNWFQDTRLPLEKIICFVYSWAYELISIKWCKGKFILIVMQLSTTTLTCAKFVIGVIGGPGLTVEVDESAYTHRKYQKGRLFPTTVVEICRVSNPNFSYFSLFFFIFWFLPEKN